MGLEVHVTGSVMSHQLDKIKYFKKHLYAKDNYQQFEIDCHRAFRLAELFRAVGHKLEEDSFYVTKASLLRLMNNTLQKNPFDYTEEFYDTQAYFLLMHHLEKHRHVIESSSRDEFVLVFEVSF